MLFCRGPWPGLEGAALARRSVFFHRWIHNLEKAVLVHKWFRDLAISHIVADTMDEMGLKLPPPRVDLAVIRRKYHAAKSEGGKVKSAKVKQKKSR